MDLSELLAGLASHLGLPPLEMHPLGYYPLEVDGMALLLYPTPDEAAVGLIGRAGMADPADFELLQDLLAANMASGTGAHVGLDENNNVMVLQWLPLANLEFARLVREIERVVNLQESWRGRLGFGSPAPSSSHAVATLA
ncbi:MAG: CesT family type III secretion system chaperone [Ramlibacter sp.]